MTLWTEHGIVYIDHGHITYTDLWFDMYTPNNTYRVSINFKHIMKFYEL